MRYLTHADLEAMAEHCPALREAMQARIEDICRPPLAIDRPDPVRDEAVRRAVAHLLLEGKDA